MRPTLTPVWFIYHDPTNHHRMIQNRIPTLSAMIDKPNQVFVSVGKPMRVHYTIKLVVQAYDRGFQLSNKRKVSFIILTFNGQVPLGVAGFQSFNHEYGDRFITLLPTGGTAEGVVLNQCGCIDGYKDTRVKDEKLLIL